MAVADGQKAVTDTVSVRAASVRNRVRTRRTAATDGSAPKHRPRAEVEARPLDASGSVGGAGPGDGSARRLCRARDAGGGRAYGDAAVTVCGYAGGGVRRGGGRNR